MKAVKWWVNGNRDEKRSVPKHGVIQVVCSSCAEDLAYFAHATIEDRRWPIVITLLSEDGTESQWDVECEYVPKYRARSRGS